MAVQPYKDQYEWLAAEHPDHTRLLKQTLRQVRRYQTGEEPKEEEIFWFDVETTGTDPQRAHVLSLAWEQGEESGVWYFDPPEGVEIPKEAIDIHGLSREELAKRRAVPFGRVAQELSSKMEGQFLGGYNVPFDIKALLTEFERLNITPPTWKGEVDVFERVRALFPERGGKGQKTLGAMAEHFGLLPEEASLHEAVTDVSLTRQMYPRVKSEERARMPGDIAARSAYLESQVKSDQMEGMLAQMMGVTGASRAELRGAIERGVEAGALERDASISQAKSYLTQTYTRGYGKEVGRYIPPWLIPYMPEHRLQMLSTAREYDPEKGVPEGYYRRKDEASVFSLQTLMESAPLARTEEGDVLMTWERGKDVKRLSMLGTHETVRVRGTGMQPTPGGTLAPSHHVEGDPTATALRVAAFPAGAPRAPGGGLLSSNLEFWQERPIYITPEEAKGVTWLPMKGAEWGPGQTMQFAGGMVPMDTGKWRYRVQDISPTPEGGYSISLERTTDVSRGNIRAAEGPSKVKFSAFDTETRITDPQGRPLGVHAAYELKDIQGFARAVYQQQQEKFFQDVEAVTGVRPDRFDWQEHGRHALQAFGDWRYKDYLQEVFIQDRMTERWMEEYRKVGALVEEGEFAPREVFQKMERPESLEYWRTPEYTLPGDLDAPRTRDTAHTAHQVWENLKRNVEQARFKVAQASGRRAEILSETHLGPAINELQRYEQEVLSQAPEEIKQWFGWPGREQGAPPPGMQRTGIFDVTTRHYALVADVQQQLSHEYNAGGLFYSAEELENLKIADPEGYRRVIEESRPRREKYQHLMRSGLSSAGAVPLPENVRELDPYKVAEIFERVKRELPSGNIFQQTDVLMKLMEEEFGDEDFLLARSGGRSLVLPSPAVARQFGAGGRLEHEETSGFLHGYRRVLSSVAGRFAGWEDAYNRYLEQTEKMLSGREVWRQSIGAFVERGLGKKVSISMALHPMEVAVPGVENEMVRVGSAPSTGSPMYSPDVWEYALSKAEKDVRGINANELVISMDTAQRLGRDADGDLVYIEPLDDRIIARKVVGPDGKPIRATDEMLAQIERMQQEGHAITQEEMADIGKHRLQTFEAAANRLGQMIGGARVASTEELAESLKEGQRMYELIGPEYNVGRRGLALLSGEGRRLLESLHMQTYSLAQRPKELTRTLQRHYDLSHYKLYSGEQGRMTGYMYGGKTSYREAGPVGVSEGTPGIYGLQREALDVLMSMGTTGERGFSDEDLGIMFGYDDESRARVTQAVKAFRAGEISKTDLWKAVEAPAEKFLLSVAGHMYGAGAIARGLEEGGTFEGMGISFEAEKLARGIYGEQKMRQLMFARSVEGWEGIVGRSLAGAPSIPEGPEQLGFTKRQAQRFRKPTAAELETDPFQEFFTSVKAHVEKKEAIAKHETQVGYRSSGEGYGSDRLSPDEEQRFFNIVGNWMAGGYPFEVALAKAALGGITRSESFIKYVESNYGLTRGELSTLHHKYSGESGLEKAQAELGAPTQRQIDTIRAQKSTQKGVMKDVVKAGTGMVYDPEKGEWISMSAGPVPSEPVGHDPAIAGGQPPQKPPGKPPEPPPEPPVPPVPPGGRGDAWEPDRAEGGKVKISRTGDPTGGRTVDKDTYELMKAMQKSLESNSMLFQSAFGASQRSVLDAMRTLSVFGDEYAELIGDTSRSVEEFSDTILKGIKTMDSAFQTLEEGRTRDWRAGSQGQRAIETYEDFMDKNPEVRAFRDRLRELTIDADRIKELQKMRGDSAAGGGGGLLGGLFRPVPAGQGGEGAPFGHLGMAFRGLFSGWELMRLQRMWGLTGAPVFNQYIPAAAEAGLAGWNASTAIGGFGGGMGMPGISQGVLQYQADQQQSIIQAGRRGYMAYGAGMAGDLFDFGRQTQAVLGPAAGAGAVLGGLGYAGGFAAGPAAALGIGAAGVLGGLALRQYTMAQAAPTAEAQLAAYRQEDLAEYGNDIPGRLARGWRRLGPAVGALFRGDIPLGELVGPTPMGMGFDIGSFAKYGIEFNQRQAAAGRRIAGTALGDLGTADRASALSHLAGQLRGGGGAWGIYDETQIMSMIQQAAPYIEGFDRMSAEDIERRTPELLDIIAQTGRSVEQFQEISQQLRLGTFGAGEALLTYGRMPDRQMMQAMSLAGKWAPFAQAFGPEAGRSIMAQSASPFQTEAERAAAGRFAGRFAGVPFIGGMAQQVQQQIAETPMQIGDLSVAGQNRAAQIGGMIQQGAMYGYQFDQPDVWNEAYVNQQWRQMPMMQAQIGMTQQLVGMGVGQTAARSAAASAGFYGGIAGIQGLQGFMQGDRGILNMIGQANQLGPFAPTGIGGIELNVGQMRDAISAGLQQVIPPQYFDTVMDAMEGIKPLVEAETGLQMGTTQMWAGFAQGRRLPTGVSAAMFGEYAAMAEAGGMRALRAEETGLRYGFQDWQVQQQRQQLQLNQVSQFGGTFESPYGGTLDTRGTFAIQQELRNLSRIWEDFTSDYNDRNRQLQYDQFMENWNVRMGRLPVQFGWQREDLEFRGAQQSLQYGWQMEDIEERLRFATGRERRALLRQQERATITYGMGMGQLATQAERINIQEQWANEDMERQKRHFEERFALQDEYQSRYRQYVDERRRLEDELQQIREFNARYNIEAANEQLDKQTELNERLRAINEAQTAIADGLEEAAAYQSQVVNLVTWFVQQFGDNGSAQLAWQDFVGEIETSLIDLGQQVHLYLTID